MMIGTMLVPPPAVSAYVPPTRARDSYPWRDVETLGQADPFAYEKGACASYVAWWENTYNHVRITNDSLGRGFVFQGLDRNWRDEALSYGWTVGKTPHVGDIALFNREVHWASGADSGSDGDHVGVVVQVWRNGDVEIRDYADPYPGELHQGRADADQFTFLDPD